MKTPLAFVVAMLLACLSADAATQLLIRTNAMWRFLDDGSNQGTAWRERSFVDAAWRSGAAELGYGDGDEATVVGFGPNSSAKYITTYFRHRFAVTNASAFTNLSLRLLRDDGAVVYLNGTEVFRSNMPTGAVNYLTAASAAASDDGDTYQLATVPTFLLQEGDNVVAVEMHQNVGTSTDLSFALELSGVKVEQTIVLNSPGHGAMGTVTSPTLDVTVSDATGDNVSVTFYGRPAGALPGRDFSIVALPDTQYYTSSKNGGLPAMFYAQTDWILSNRVSRNIAFVTQLGDCVENGDAFLSEWQVATNAFYRIEDPIRSALPEGVPYGIAVGNHDQSPLGNPDGATRYYNQFFGEAHFAGRSYYGGHYGTNNDNHFQLFSASGLDFIAVHLEFNTNGTSGPVLSWANNLLQTYSNRRAIVITHWMINTGNPASFSPQGQLIYNALRTNANLFLLLGGHVTDEGQRVDTFNGNTVYSLLSDYQGRASGGNGLLRIMEFSPSNNVIRVKTYSPYVNQFETDANSQFTLNYNMQPLGAAYSVIGTGSGIASGAHATTVWSGLLPNTAYEWYVVVSDGVNSSTSPTWRFTTGAGGPMAPTVSLSSPANNAVFSEPAEISLAASASDADGTISRVEFFANESKIGEVTAEPFAGTWSAVPEGSYALTAVATDNSGITATSSVVNISVISGPVPNAPPTVSISSPANNAQFTAPANVAISASAADSDGALAKVEFFNGTTKIGEALAAPYSMTWGQVAEGSYTLRAIATDNAGAQGTSAPVSIAVLAPSETAVITRGPYLQLGTPTSMVVRWRTDVATDTRLRLGTNSSNLNLLFTDTASVTDHVATVTGLQPNTKYFYEMGTSRGWFTPDGNDFFVTGPTPGSVKPTRVWILGDSGTANADAARVRDAYLNFTGSRGTDLLLMLGDNAYNNGTDAEYQAAVFNFYPSVLQNTVLWPTIGNHDTAGSANPPSSLPYFRMFTLPMNGEAGGVASGTEKYYSFDYANVHFICLDSMSSTRTANSPMITWLQADLSATTQQWVIAFWHHPPYSKGSHDSDSELQLVEMRNYALPLLEAGGVDLVFSGHSHSYERSFLLDGHYGLSSTLLQSMKKNAGSGREDSLDGAYTKPAGPTSNNGAVYTVAGASGKLEGGTLNHPAMFLSSNVLGSVVLDVFSNRVDVIYLGTNGAALDRFTMIKDVPPPPVPAPPSGIIAIALSGSEVELRWTDNSGNEQSFELERALDGTNFVLLATLGANVTNGVDAGLVAATTYHYRVRAVNASGASAYSQIASATTTGAMLPPAPTGLTATPSDRLVTLLWNGTPNTYSYNIRRAEQQGGPYGQIAYGIGTASYTDNNVENGRTYYYVVSAVGDAGEGPDSAEASATPMLPVPFPPANVTATDGDSTVVLAWDASRFAQSYTVKRSETAGGPYTDVASDVAGTNFNDTAVANGGSYFYVIAAVNPSGQSSNSVEVVGNPRAMPATPENFDAVAGDATVFLRWDAAAGATSYRVERALGDEPFQVLATIETTTFTDASVANDTLYAYRIVARNENVASAPTFELFVIPALQPPGAPATLIATASDAQVSLIWSAVTKADNYSVRRATTPGGPYTEIASALAVTNYNDVTVANGTTYFYVVLAHNAAGASSNSAEASATPLARPTAPENLQATPVSAAQINLTWSDNSAVEAAFEVESSLDGNAWSLLATLPTNTTAHSVQNLSPATTYLFRVRALNASGASAYAAVASATTFDQPPAAPQNLAAVAVSASRINLSWADAAANETGFVIEQSLNGSSYTQIASLAANTTTHSVTGLASGTTYFFRIRAVNAFGASPDVQASANTLSLPAAPANVTSSPSNALVRLSWGAVTGATSYNVKRSLSSAGPFTTIQTVTSLTFTNTGLINGTTYHYVISANATAGEGANSAVVSATPLAPPAAPSSVTVTSLSASQLRVNWNDNSTNELGFRIERATANGGPFTEVGTVGAGVRTFTDSGLQANKTYYYRVRAYHSAGASAFSNTASGKTKR